MLSRTAIHAAVFADETVRPGIRSQQGDEPKLDMPIRNLHKLLHPSSVAVIGATNREGMAGQVVMHNLLKGGFEGPILPVAQDEQAVAGVFAYGAVDDLPLTPDLAVICTAPDRVAETIGAVAARGTRAAVVMLNAGGHLSRGEPRALEEAILKAAQPHGLRVLGPNGLGLMVPSIGLNASVAPGAALPGGIAFVSQSGTVAAAVLDWAREHGIGFSCFLSLGDTADIDFGDVIDYLGSDAATRAILLYVESIRRGRTFMSAGRGASRNKPILVIKSGRSDEAKSVAGFRAGVFVGEDAAYDAAIRRAGMLRVYSFGELFAAVETLARVRTIRGGRLAVLANGCGIAVMAVDQLFLNGGTLARFSEGLTSRLATAVPSGWPSSNPVNVAIDASPEIYEEAAKTILSSAEVDALLVLHSPVGRADSTEAAKAVIRAAFETRGCVLTSWMGGERVVRARRLFAEAGIPTYDTPTRAVDALMHLVRYRQNQQLLMETPVSASHEFEEATVKARAIISAALKRGLKALSGNDAAEVIAAYGIASATSPVVRTPEQAGRAAVTMGFPVSLALVGSSIARGAAIGWMDHGLESEERVVAAAQNMFMTASAFHPDAHIEGFRLEREPVRAAIREVRVGVGDDPVFGPVILFGHGGSAADVVDDFAVALPPLNMSLARELIARTRIAKLLSAFAELPAANIDALCETLVHVSQMVVDLPELASLMINPLYVDQQGTLAVSTSIAIREGMGVGDIRLAIRSYPKELEEEFTLPDGRRLLIRPIRPEDEPAHYDFLSKVSPDDIRLRFFGLIRTLPHSEMARLTQIDYDREMAFVATDVKPDGGFETLGVVRTITDLHNDTAEYAVLVRSDLKGQRLGWKLMDKMIAYCRSRGTRSIVGQVLRENKRMLDLVYALGFTGRLSPVDQDIMEVTLVL